ncbi:MAG: hypothetical protein J5844_03310 [Clostridia bacterium]|nr:hypothetical protein [Clostridia bacterium]
MSKFLIGWDEQSIVPDKKVNLFGQFYERISQYVETDITATAMAIECDGDEAIIVSLDIVHVQDFLLKMVREKLKTVIPDFPSEKLIIGATHSHTSIGYGMPFTGAKRGGAPVKPILAEFAPKDAKYKSLVTPTKDVLTPAEATELLVDRLSTAAANAWKSRKEAFYANEFGRAPVGMCRRVEYDDGTAQMWGDVNTANFTCLEGGNDSGIELLYMFGKDRKLTGIVANIACPAQVLEHRSFISADYWGYVKENLRAKLGKDIYLLALCGAGGDQCPRDLIRWVNGETPINDPNIHRPNYIERKADPSMFDVKGCKLIGKRVSNEILSVYEEIEDVKDEIDFTHKTMTLDLPLRRATMKQHDEAVREIEYYFAKNADKKEFTYEDTAKLHVYEGTIRRFREQQNKEVVPTEVHIIRFGDVAFATNPFELFLDYGNQIKARSYAKQTFIMQLSCGAYGYLPTEKAENHGHYSAYISSGRVGHEGGDLLVRESITEINKMFKE